MKVPFLELETQHEILKAEIKENINKVINESQFYNGTFTKQFEKAWANYLNVNHCIGVANGTDALFIALKALGIGPNHEVITPAHSWISSAEVISLAGAKPVFVDEEPHFYTINPDLIESNITNKTKAIIVVHLAGQAANIDQIVEIANKYSLYIIEDCAQAHGTEWKNHKTGSFGDIATFSFYPTKNLGAMGDAGCIVTNNEKIAKFCKKFANHGGLHKNQHEIEGINSRLDEIQAAVLMAKLPYINDFIKSRRNLAQIYKDKLVEIDEIILPKTQNESFHTFHLFMIKSNTRNKLKEFLFSNNIGTDIHYPVALPFIPAYQFLKHKSNDFPEAAKTQNQILSLPIYPELTQTKIEYVINTIKDFFSNHS